MWLQFAHADLVSQTLFSYPELNHTPGECSGGKRLYLSAFHFTTEHTTGISVKVGGAKHNLCEKQQLRLIKTETSGGNMFDFFLQR